MRFALLSFIVFVLSAFNYFAAAQIITGTITNTITQQPIPFVNIGLSSRGIGTVANEQGQYKLLHDVALGTDTVKISSIGFQPRVMQLSELQLNPQIALNPASTNLTEVYVSAPNNQLHTHTLGLAKNFNNVLLHMHSNQLGTELGTIIHLRRHPSMVQSLHIGIAKNDVGPVTFRLNLYRLDETSRPTNEKLLQRNVLLVASPQRGILTADITMDHLLLGEDFLLAVEWVKGSDGDIPDLQKRLSFNGGLALGSILYTRRTSQAAWEKMSYTSNLPLMGLKPQVAFYATVRD